MKAFFALLAVTAFATFSGAAQSDEALLASSPTEPAMISYSALGREFAIGPADVFDIEISSSGGLTDIFVRLAPPAGAALEGVTTRAQGEPMAVSLCGLQVHQVNSLAPNTGGALYIPNLIFVQADALRSVWHGRETCATLDPEVFPIGQ